MISDHIIPVARRVYGGPLNAKLHSPKQPEMSSWVAHAILVMAFRFGDTEAGQLVNDLIRDARTHRVASREFTTNRGKRSWVVLCKFAPFVSGSIFTIKET
jgi:hypothetical protein